VWLAGEGPRLRRASSDGWKAKGWHMDRARAALFDVRALFSSLDTQRKQRGMSWQEVAREVGVSPSTLVGMPMRRFLEGDGVLQMLSWLGRSPESFVPGHLPTEADGAWPQVERGRGLRFDARALHAALNARRVERGMTWRQVAQEIGGIQAASLTRIARGGRLGFPSVMKIVGWLGRPAGEFTRVCIR
jgi:transcriptional regulator with XRE-family HTH domain